MEKSKAMRWVKALRSGKYKQSEEYLFNSNKKEYCCLGVLARVSGYSDKDINRYGALDFNSEVLEKCGIADPHGTPRNFEDLIFKRNGVTEIIDNLALANDRGISFKRIATWIEKNYELL